MRWVDSSLLISSAPLFPTAAMAAPSLPSSSSSKTLSLRSLFLALPTRHLGRTQAAPPRRAAAVISMSTEAGVGVMGTKLGMMTFFEPQGAAVPVTVVGFREGNIVTQVKTSATDGYDAVQIGYRRVRDKKLTKPELGHLEKAGAIPLRHLQEFRLQSIEGFEPGQRLDLESIFKEGDIVDVSGTSIGKGFQGGCRLETRCSISAPTEVVCCFVFGQGVSRGTTSREGRCRTDRRVIELSDRSGRGRRRGECTRGRRCPEGWEGPRPRSASSRSLKSTPISASS